MPNLIRRRTLAALAVAIAFSPFFAPRADMFGFQTPTTGYPTNTGYTNTGYTNTGYPAANTNGGITSSFSQKDLMKLSKKQDRTDQQLERKLTQSDKLQEQIDELESKIEDAQNAGTTDDEEITEGITSSTTPKSKQTLKQMKAKLKELKAKKKALDKEIEKLEKKSDTLDEVASQAESEQAAAQQAAAQQAAQQQAAQQQAMSPETMAAGLMQALMQKAMTPTTNNTTPANTNFTPTNNTNPTVTNPAVTQAAPTVPDECAGLADLEKKVNGETVPGTDSADPKAANAAKAAAASKATAAGNQPAPADAPSAAAKQAIDENKADADAAKLAALKEKCKPKINTDNPESTASDIKPGGKIDSVEEAKALVAQKNGECIWGANSSSSNACQCASLAKEIAGLDRASSWKTGPQATTDLAPGTAIATMDAGGYCNAANRGGQHGCHAAIYLGNNQVLEQWVGSGGPRVSTWSASKLATYNVVISGRQTGAWLMFHPFLEAPLWVVLNLSPQPLGMGLLNS